LIDYRYKTYLENEVRSTFTGRLPMPAAE